MINLTGVRVLVVDDEVFMRITVRRMLRMLGDVEVEEAGDGESALAAIVSFEPDVILCDVSMKPMSGLQFVERLRRDADPVVSGKPVIMLTGKSDQDTIRSAILLGISGYVLKPVSAKDLAARLQVALEKKAKP